MSILVGNAPCSWGSLEFEGLAAEPIGYGRMLDELGGTGYTGTELGDWGYMPTDPDLLAIALVDRGLTLTGAFVPVALADAAAHDDGLAVAVRTANLLQAAAARLDQHVAPFLVLADNNGTDPVRTQNAGRVTPEMGLSPLQWETFAAGANRIAEAVLQKTGLRTVFHHHCAGYVETENEIAELLARTDPTLLGVVFDTGHYAFGAGSCQGIVAALNRFADRIWYMHFKDCDPQMMAKAQVNEWDYFESVRNGVFCELGKGCVDFSAVYGWMRRQGYSGYVTVEQDVLPGMGMPFESAQRNREFLRTIGL